MFNTTKRLATHSQSFLLNGCFMPFSFELFGTREKCRIFASNKTKPTETT